MRTSTDTRRENGATPIFIRGKWSVIAFAAVAASTLGAGAIMQAHAHDERQTRRADVPSGSADLILPQLRAGTYRLTVREADGMGLVGSLQREPDFEAPRTFKKLPAWRDRSPRLKLRVPDEPAPRRVAKPEFKVRTGDVDTIVVPKNFAMIDAPRRVVARKRFEAGWSGPNISGDRLELVARGQRACEASVLGISVHEYDVNQDGEFTFLAPMRAGAYELVYCSANQQRVLARHPIQVVAGKTQRAGVERISRLRPESNAQATTRPSFELNSSVDDDDALPRVRFIAPLASARTATLDDERDKEPVFTVRPKRFVEDTDDRSKVATPVGRFRFNSQQLAQADPVRPAFSVRPSFEDDFEAEDVPERTGNQDAEEVIDIAPRRRSTVEERTPRLQPEPRVRIFVDDEASDSDIDGERDQADQRPSFEEDDAFEREATRQDRPSFDADSETGSEAENRSFDEGFEPLEEEDVARRPAFEDEPEQDREEVTRTEASQFDQDDALDLQDRSASQDREEPQREADFARRPSFEEEDAQETKEASSTPTPQFDDEPAFDDEPSFGNERDTRQQDFAKPTEEVRDEAPVERADDFRDDEVDVASAVARNRARYGDGTGGDDEFFSIRGRYNWYKPVQPSPSEQTATLPKRFEEADDNRDATDDGRRRTPTRNERDAEDEQTDDRIIELEGRDAFDQRRADRRAIFAALPKDKPVERERDFDDFASNERNGGDQDAVFGPPVSDDETQFASRNTDEDLLDEDRGFDASSRTGAATGPIEMVRKTNNNQVAPQFDRIQPVKAGYRFAAGWTGDIRRKGWIAVARKEARIGDYISLRSAERAGEKKFRAPSEPGRYELRFLSQDRRVVLARQSFEVEPATVRLVALEFVDPSDELNVWWAGPGEGTDSLTLARVGTRDSRYLTKQSVGKGNPLTLKAPTQPGTYEMRYINGTDNRVLFRRKLVVAESQPLLLGP